MSYPNVLNYTSTNKITIQDVRETCQEESDVLQQNIIDAINEVTKNGGGATQGITPLTQNITRAMGDYWFSIDGTIPPGGLPHLGHLVSRATYGDFYSWLSSTKTIMTDAEWLAYANSHGGCCPYYSSGDGSTTFRTPSYPDTFLKIVNDMNKSSLYEEEGLPQVEITNKTDIKLQNGTIATSKTARFEAAGTGYGALLSASNASNTGSVGMDLYRHSYPTGRSDLIPRNSIYGNSDHVTPKNISMLIGVYAVGAIVPVGTTDAEKIMSGVTRVEGLLDTKVDKTSPYITEHWSSGTEWYRVYSDGWIEQGGLITYTSARSVITSVTLLKEMSTTNYNVYVQGISPDRATNSSWVFCNGVSYITTIGFITQVYGVSASDVTIGMRWKVEGFLKEE